MAYHTYTTQALILDARPFGEGNLSVFLFSKELGAIRARAQNARALASKLRLSLTAYSCGNYALVRGKRGWKITGAKSEGNLFNQFRDDRKKKVVVAKLFNLLRSLLHGESVDKRLYSSVIEALQFLEENAATEEEMGAFEILAALRILYVLGFVSDDRETSSFLKEKFSVRLIDALKDSNLRKNILRVVNEALREAV